MGQVRHERIVSDPDVMMGKPTIRGTRITVELILEKLGQGMTIDEMLEAYPHPGEGAGAGGAAVRRRLSARRGRGNSALSAENHRKFALASKNHRKIAKFGTWPARRKARKSRGAVCRAGY
jgi:hypothetical protein